MRKSGILMHISSLPSDYGIGTMGKEAYKFVDFLKSAKQKCWQILPIGPTSYGDSPYQSFSTNAGNPYFIDMDILREEGLLKKSDYSKLDWGKDRKNVEYETIYENRFKVLKIAFEEFKKASNGRVVTYGIQNDADYRADNIQLGIEGTNFSLIYENKEYPVHTNLVALYNVYNLLAAIAGMHQGGLDLEKILECVNDLKQVDGRLERIDEGQPFNVIVDYAHTPDGFEKIFEYAQMITPSDRNIIAVFGSAGRRDAKKRKVMGSIADRYCGNIIITDEDPRTDDPTAIANDIKSGIENANTIYIPDRSDAIRQAIEIANVKDTILILGKGDEDYMA